MNEVPIPSWTSGNMVSERSQTPEDHVLYSSIYLKQAHPETKRSVNGSNCFMSTECHFAVLEVF